ncbi:MAG: nitrate reductase cytochrome c-type subunit [Campylobacter sp.]|nr:nitrate reductase cytochrome c-type subunit [Campylobacter sp.]
MKRLAFIIAFLGTFALAISLETPLSDNAVLPDINWTKEPAGLSTRLPRSFENAPPLIPHDLEGLLPITTDMNMCTTCHMPEFAADAGSTAIPKSHLVDMISGKDLHGMLSMERYNCVACHVPQANAAPLVANKFTPEFRDEKSKTSSNLLDILNEGVK